MGLYVGEQAYLRSSWNILDGFLVFVSLIDIVVSMAGGAKILGVLRVLRLLRTLRPLRYKDLQFILFVRSVFKVISNGGSVYLHLDAVLSSRSNFRRSSHFRVISRAPGLKLVVETLITSLKPIGNIVLICCAFFIIFGILGVQVGKEDQSFK